MFCIILGLLSWRIRLNTHLSTSMDILKCNIKDVLSWVSKIDWLMVVQNVRKTMHEWCLGLNWRIIVASPFTREYECHYHYLSPIFNSTKRWTNFRSINWHFENLLLSWELHWGQLGLHITLSWKKRLYYRWM